MGGEGEQNAQRTIIHEKGVAKLSRYVCVHIYTHIDLSIYIDISIDLCCACMCICILEAGRVLADRLLSDRAHLWARLSSATGDTRDLSLSLSLALSLSLSLPLSLCLSLSLSICIYTDMIRTYCRDSMHPAFAWRLLPSPVGDSESIAWSKLQAPCTRLSITTTAYCNPSSKQGMQYRIL